MCVPHLCRCDSPVDARGLHSIFCKQAPGRSSTHHMLNDLVARAFAAVPVEPVGLVRQDGKRPDGLTLIPFEGGRSLTWDVTVIVCSTADSYIDLAVQGPAAVWRRWQPLAMRRNVTQLCGLTMISSRSRSRPWDRPINESATSFLYDSGRGISPVSGEDREPQFLFQLISVATQRFNAVLCTTVFFCLPTTRISAAPDFNFLH